MNPEEAGPIVIWEITCPRTCYGAAVLVPPPEKTLPEMEQAVAEHFAAEPISYAAENLT